MKLNERSRKNLEGVHPELVRLVRAVSPPPGYEVIITEGMRTFERQQELLKAGKSKTMNSRHLTGHAIDFVVKRHGKVTWEFDAYRKVAETFKESSRMLYIPITWGGDWGFKDGTHIQLDWEAFPLVEGQKKASTSKTVAAAGVGGLSLAIPDLLSLFQSIPPEVGKWLQIGLAIAIVVFIVYERVGKIKREGV